MGILNAIDLKQKIKKSEYNARMEKLEIKLGQLERKALDNKVPITIVFEGWGASGKGRQINELLQVLDPRGRQSIFDTSSQSRRDLPTVYVAVLDQNPRTRAHGDLRSELVQSIHCGEIRYDDGQAAG